MPAGILCVAAHTCQEENNWYLQKNRFSACKQVVLSHIIVAWMYPMPPLQADIHHQNV